MWREVKNVKICVVPLIVNEIPFRPTHKDKPLLTTKRRLESHTMGVKQGKLTEERTVIKAIGQEIRICEKLKKQKRTVVRLPTCKNIRKLNMNTSTVLVLALICRHLPFAVHRRRSCLYYSRLHIWPTV